MDGHAKIEGHFLKRFMKHIFLIKHDNIRQFCEANLYIYRSTAGCVKLM